MLKLARADQTQRTLFRLKAGPMTPMTKRYYRASLCWTVCALSMTCGGCSGSGGSHTLDMHALYCVPLLAEPTEESGAQSGAKRRDENTTIEAVCIQSILCRSSSFVSTGYKSWSLIDHQSSHVTAARTTDCSHRLEMNEQNTSAVPTVVALDDTATGHSDAAGPKELHIEPSSPSAGNTTGESTSTSAGLDDAQVGADGSPLQVAVALPDEVDTEGKEEFWDLKMSWSGKMFEMRVGSNDM